MIDWNKLGPLPLRRQTDPASRERLAAASLAKKSAKHKGRNHWRNWERRQMAKAARAVGAAKQAAKRPAMRRYLAEVRAYWGGERADMPSKI